MDTDLALGDVEMTDDELAGVHGGFLTQTELEPCLYELNAGDDHVFM